MAWFLQAANDVKSSADSNMLSLPLHYRGLLLFGERDDGM